MNANELANEAEKQSELIYLVTDERVAQQLSQMFKNYATMLRQQQAENRRCIEALNQIGSGTITGEETNYKAIVSVMRDIANDALYELNRNTMMTWDDVDKEAQEK